MSDTEKRAVPELLCPAGSRISLEAAIEGGADAIYFGAGEFNARMRAENFKGDELREALSLCRAYGIKSYITLNTRLYDSEIPDALRLSCKLYEYGADGLIVADHGLASAIHEILPEFELHASTQLSGHTVSDATALKELGFSRMVCPREFSEEQLRKLCNASPIEIEMFIHGAYCVSFSGQCLMSAVMGGRSGNRGECAQPCRQPYTMCEKKGYPISLKDMCLAGHITDIISSGVSSLKIEGRQKPPEYVYGVTKIYRRLLNEKRNATEDETAALASIFSRDGFTDGYFTGCGSNMRGVRTYDDFLTMDKTPFPGLSRKVPMSVSLKVKSGEKAVFAAKTPTKSVRVESEFPLVGGSVHPITYEGAEKNSGRLGSTPYTLADFRLDCDDEAPLTLSCLNALRRAAVEALIKSDRNIPENIDYSPHSTRKKERKGTPAFAAEFMSVEQITPLAKEFFNEIYLPLGVDNNFGVSLPAILPDGEKNEEMWKELAGRSILVHHTGQLYEAVRRGFSPTCSLRLNVFNSETAEVLSSMGAASLTLSPELKTGAMRDICCGTAKKKVTVYGRLPLMTTARCAISDGGTKCPHGKCGLSGCRKMSGDVLCRSSITDRHGISFPVFGMPDCENIIFNAYPLYSADRQDAMTKTDADIYSFIFTDETADECDKIIMAYKSKTPPADAAKVKRL